MKSKGKKYLEQPCSMAVLGPYLASGNLIYSADGQLIATVLENHPDQRVAQDTAKLLASSYEAVSALISKQQASYASYLQDGDPDWDFSGAAVAEAQDVIYKSGFRTK